MTSHHHNHHQFHKFVHFLHNPLYTIKKNFKNLNAYISCFDVFSLSSLIVDSWNKTDWLKSKKTADLKHWKPFLKSLGILYYCYHREKTKCDEYYLQHNGTFDFPWECRWRCHDNYAVQLHNNHLIYTLSNRHLQNLVYIFHIYSFPIIKNYKTFQGKKAKDIIHSFFFKDTSEIFGKIIQLSQAQR